MLKIFFSDSKPTITASFMPAKSAAQQQEKRIRFSQNLLFYNFFCFVQYNKEYTSKNQAYVTFGLRKGMNGMLKTQLQDGRLTVYLSGEIDHHIAKKIRQEMDSLIESEACAMLILDFKHVTFMDSSGIGLVMGRYKMMQSLGGQVQVVNVSAHIAKIMRLAGLDQLAVLKR